MSWLEEMLILGGMCLDLFAVMACRGSLIAKIERKRLSLLCSFTAFCQTVVFLAGYLLSALVERQAGGRETVLGKFFAAMIFLGLGIRLLIQVWKNEPVTEKRELSPKWRPNLQQVAASAYMLPAGSAFRFLEFEAPVSVLMLLAFSILGTSLGIYTGYRLGFEQKRKAQAAGAVILLLAAADILTRLAWRQF